MNVLVMAGQVMDAAAEAGAEDVVATEGEDGPVEGFKVYISTSSWLTCSLYHGFISRLSHCCEM